MYEDGYPEDAKPKARAFILTRNCQLIFLARIKPEQSVYHVTVGGKIEDGESTEECVRRELKEEIDAEALIGRPFLTLLDTTYHVALATRLGPKPFTGPEFENPEFGRFAIASVPLSKAISPEFDLRPELLGDFLRKYGQAVVAEGKRLLATTY